MRIREFLRAILLLGIACVQPAVGEEIRDYYSEPGINPFKETLNQNFNEQIDPFSGTLQLKYAEVHVPGNGGMDINLTRTYTSLQTNAYPTPSINGLGWNMHFGRIVVPRAHLAKMCNQTIYNANTNDNPSLELPDGSRELLVLNGIQNDGTLITRSNWRGQCSAQPGMVVTAPDGTRYTMDRFDNTQNEPSWLATRIEDVHGNWIAIDYATSQAGVTYMTAVRRSEDGTVLTFEYENQETLGIALSAINAPGGQRWTYAYELIPGDMFSFYKQLVRATRPDGKSWTYTYNPKMPDPNPGDEIPEDGIASYSLNRVTYPHGAHIDYTYQFVVFAPDSMDKTTAIHTKLVGGTGVTAGSWTFAFAPHSLPYDDSYGGQLRHDVTTVTAPEAIYRYVHMGKDYRNGAAGQTVFVRPSFVGMLIMKETQRRGQGGGAVERQANSWGQRKISNEDFWHGGFRSWWRDDGTYVPVLLGEYLSRDSQISGSQYAHARLYSNHDIYGNPGGVYEYSNLANQPARQGLYTYYTDTVKWIIGLPQNETHQSVNGTQETTVGTVEREYDSNGALRKIVELGEETRFTYTGAGDLETVRDARGKIIHFSDYRRGIAQHEDRPESVTVQRVVNDTGTLRSETNGRGFTTRYTYDDVNRLTAIDYPIKADVGIDYVDGNGVYKRILTRAGYRQTETVNDFNETLRTERRDTVSGETMVRTSTFDAHGRETFESYPNSAIGITKAYDALGRLERTQHPDSTAVVYSYDDAHVTVTNERGFATTYLYLVYGNDFAGQFPASIAEPENVSTSITRDIWGNPLQVFQGERLPDNSIRGYGKTYRYNGRHLLVESVEREVGTTTFGHDEVGNVISERVNNLAPVTFVYDGLNRRTRVDFSDATPDVVTVYDDNDNLEHVTKGATQWAYVYDENDNLRSETLTISHPLFAPRSYALAYEYADLDVVSRTTYPSGLAVDYAPDSFGRASRVGTFASNFSYHPNGQLASYQLANGVVTSVALNQRLMTQAISAPGVMNLSYGYDAGGNVMQINDAIDSSKNVLMNGNSYDGLDRLLGAQGKWGSAAFTYDFHGNLLTKDIGAKGMKFSLDSQRRARQIEKYMPNNPYEQPTYLNFDFDGRGNATARRQYNGSYIFESIDEQLFDYDSASQLIRARVNRMTASGTTAIANKDYSYDGNGLRVLEQTHGSYDIRFSVYGRGGQLMFEDSLAECTRTDYLRLGALSIARSDDRSAVPSLDTDADLIPDCMELQLGLNPNLASDAAADSDSDGLTNLEEYRAGTSLTRADTDGDGLSDRDELNRDLTDPNISDTDGDGLADGIEAANPQLDPRSNDRDHDGVSDFWEVRLGTNPGNAADGLNDSDADGFSNRQESGAENDPELATSQPARGTQLWASNTLSAIIGTAAIGPDRTIYVTSGDGRVHAFYPDGKQRWEFAVPYSTVYEPTVGPDGSIYVVSQLNGGVIDGAPRSFVRALNPDGTEKWVRPTPDYLNTAASVGANGRLYIGAFRATWSTYSGVLMSLDANGLNPMYALLQNSLRVQPAVDRNGDVYASDSGGRVYAFTSSLTQRWSYDLRSTPGVVPSVGDDGTVYVGDGDGYIYALTATGTLRWEQQVSPYSQRSSVAIGADGTLYVGTYDSKLLALNAADGTQRWSAPTGGTVYTPAIAANGNVYATTYGGSLVAFDAAGAQLWNTATSGRVQAAPVVDRDGTVYFGSQTGQLFAFADNSGGPARAPWPMHRHDAAGTNYRCFNEKAFSILGDTDGDRIDDCAELRYGLDPANAADGAADADGDGLRNWEEHERGTRLDLADTDGDGLNDGLEVLTYHTNPLAADSDHDTIPDGREVDLHTNPLDPVDAGVDSDNDGFSNRQEMLAGTDPVNATSRPVEGQLVRATSGQARHVVVGRDGTIYQTLASGPGNILEALYPDFTPKWRIPVATYETPTIGADGSIYIVEVASQSKQRILALWPNGLIRWTHTVDAPYWNHGIFGPVVIGAGGKIHFIYSTENGQGDFLRTLDSNGTPSASWPGSMQFFGRDPTVAVGPDGSVAVYDAYYSLSYYNGAGAMLWQTRKSPVISGGTGAVVFGSDGTVYVTNGGLYALNPANGTVRWQQNSAHGTPLIDANNNLILYCAYGRTGICAVGTNGQIVWQETTGYEYSGMSVIDASGAILAYTTNDRFVAFNGNGTVRWEAALTPSTGYKGSNYPIVLGDGTIYVPAAPQDLLIIGGGRGLASSPWPAPARDYKNSRNTAGITDIAVSPAPAVVITAPRTGNVRVEVGENITVSAFASDLADGDLSAAIHWSSNLDGPLGIGATQSLMPLSAGMHTLTASVTDSAGLSGSIALPVEKGIFPPTLGLFSPTDGAFFDVRQPIYFQGSATDQRDGDVSQRIVWTSSRDGQIGVGMSFFSANLSTGAHVITATVTDLAGASDTKFVNITVQIQGPTFYIPTPEYMENIEYGVAKDFSAYATDAVDGDVSSSIRWSSDRDGPLGTGNHVVTNLSLGAHVITITASDNGGTVTTVERPVLVRHLPPTIAYLEPYPSNYQVGEALQFLAYATDSKDGEVSDSIQWTSSLDGPIGTGGGYFSRSNLSVGSHRITVSVTDSDGETAHDQRYINVVSPNNAAPYVFITEPADGTEVYSTDPVQLRASGADTEDASVAISWSSSRDGALGTGESLTTSSLSIGTHTIKAAVTDSGGAKAASLIQLIIMPLPANFPAAVTITPLGRGSAYSNVDAFSLSGTAIDREDGNISNRLQWSSDLNGVLGSGATVFVSGLSVGMHTITARVVDNYGTAVAQTYLLEILNAGEYGPFHFQDFFDGSFTADWVAFDDGTPTASNWVVTGGRMVEKGDAQAGAVAGTAIEKPGTYLRQTSGAYWLDYRLEATLRSTDDDALGLMFRYVDNDNYYRFSMDRERSYRRLVRKVNGVYATLWQEAVPVRYSTSTNYAVAITAQGSTITLSINGTQLYSGTDTGLRRGTIALYAWGENQAQFDNVRVFNLRTTSSNDAPLVTISSPANGSTVLVGSVVSLNGTALDFEDGTVSHAIAWSSSRDGALGTGATLNLSSLTVGAHVITASATDSRSATGTAAVNLTVNQPFNEPPVLNVTSPANGATFNIGTMVSFVGTATDVEDGTISNGISWTSSKNGLFATGASVSVGTLSAGAHVITARITDSGGKFVTATRNITIVVPGNNLPTITLTAPLNGSAQAVGQTVALAATASDTEDGNITAKIAWSSSINGALGTGGTVNATTLTGGVHTITATVNDIMGGTRSVTASITVVPTAAILVRDDFNDNNSNGWAVTTQGTVSAPAVWTVTGGVLRQTSDVSSTPVTAATIPKLGTFMRYTNTGTWSNYSVTAEIRSSDNDTLGVMFRHSGTGSSQSYYRFSMDSELPNRRLAKLRSNGTWTTLWEDSTTAYALNRTYVFEAIANGTTLTVKLDGAQLWTGTDATNPNSSGSVAMYSWRNTGAQFDNVLVRNLSVPLSSSGEPRRGLDRVRKPEPMLASSEPRRGPPRPRAPERAPLIAMTTSEYRQNGGGVR